MAAGLESQLSDAGLAERFREAWGQALLKVGAAEAEAGRVLQRAGALAGKGEEEVRRLVVEFGERLTQQRKEFERALDAGVARALSRLKVPQREQVEVLWSRLARLGERMNALDRKN